MSKPETDALTDLLVTAVSDLLIEDSPEQRAEAARRLGRTNSKFAVWYLIQALSDEAPEVRLAAVEALGEIADPAAIDPLNSLLERETSSLVSRTTILEAMNKVRQGRSGEVLSSSPAAPPPADDWLFREVEYAPESSASASKPNEADSSSQPASADNANEGTSRPLDSPFQEPAAVRLDEERQRLEESYRRAAAERHLIEETRRRSNEEVSRRAEGELLRLETDEESLARLQENLARRRAQVEAATREAEEHSRGLKEIEDRVRADETARRLIEQESLRLEADNRFRAEQARQRVEELHHQAAEQQKSAEELK